MRYALHLIALCAACSLLLPMAAQGQGKELDPDSPAGVEYQLPLEQARKNALGRSKDASGRERTGVASLFGAGVVPAKTTARGQGGGQDGQQREDSQGDRASADDSRASGRDGDTSVGTAAESLKPSALGAPDAEGGSATLRIAGIALAVLLLGGLLGLGLRRSLHPTGE